MSRCNTVYDALDSVRRLPGPVLGALSTEAIVGSKMPRLQAFLMGLKFGNLGEGTPPFSLFGAWLSVRESGIPDSHNLSLHWIEKNYGPDGAFDVFYERLDEYRSCHILDVVRSAGPFAPSFTIGDARARPEDPNLVVIRQFAPFTIHSWVAVFPDKEQVNVPFFSKVGAAMRDASKVWGIDAASWQGVSA